MNIQPEHFQQHRNVSMRKLYLPVFAAALTFVLLFFASSEGIANHLFLYVRVARLYTEEAPEQLLMPVQDVQKKQVANTWRAPRGGDRLHEGQDIFAPRGTPIYSVARGYVYSIGENTLGGQTVSVIGAGGRVYYYAHLDSYEPSLAEGDYVTPLTILGFVGTTGNAQGTPPHLHFGVYTPSGAINPLPLLTDRKEPRRRSVNRKEGTEK